MNQLTQKVTEIFAKNPPVAHDIKHALRVSFLAKHIALNENYDPQIAEITGLLHDVGRTLQKEDKDHGPRGIPLARELLNKYTQFDEKTKEEILHAIAIHSEKFTQGKLANILQDADKLDGMGAIGLIRGFTHKHSLPDYNPDDIRGNNYKYPPKTLSEHIKFLLEFENMLYTNTAQKIAKPRAEFLKNFLTELQREVEESTILLK